MRATGCDVGKIITVGSNVQKALYKNDNIKAFLTATYQIQTWEFFMQAAE